MADHLVKSSRRSTSSEINLVRAEESLVLSLDDTEAVKEKAQISGYFRRSLLKAILAHPRCRGIRVYPDFSDDQNVMLKIIGGEGPSRRDIRDGMAGRFYAQEELRFADEETESRLRNMTSNSEFLFRKAYFTAADIEYLLRDDADGIRFYSTQLQYGDVDEPVYTMTAVAERAVGGESQAISSALPCPPHCGGGNYTDSDTFA